jgi:tetratricopeptide (TPR) repeat protein
VEQSLLAEELERAEGLMVQGETELAHDMLAKLAEDAEEYVDKNCATTKDQQYFSFPTAFDYLAYVRVEQDPRTLFDVGEPLDRLYEDLAHTEVMLDNREGAMAALKQAVRWNPMDCASRLNLAELYRADGDINEFLALTYSVFERASETSHLVRAYLNFSRWFLAGKHDRQAAACLHAAQSLEGENPELVEECERARDTNHDPRTLSKAEAEQLLEDEGLPYGANAEIAICLLGCGLDAAHAGDRASATTYIVRARDLVGEEIAEMLLQALKDADDDLSAETGAESRA